MRNFNKIIVGLELNRDGDMLTSGSRRASEQALWVAKKNGSSIVFAHSTYNDEYHGALVANQPVVHEGLSKEGREALQAIVSEASDAQVPATLELSEDRVWLDITRLAMRDEADLVIVGKRNEDANDGRRLGSVATKLLRKCPSAVWVVKPNSSLLHKSVLVATDLEKVGDLAVRYGTYVAERNDCDLHIVHAWQVPFAMQMEACHMKDEDFASELTKIRQAAVDHIRESGSLQLMERKPHIHTAKGSPSDTICAAVEQYDPDLLVMGTVSRAGLAGVLIGSTAERLLNRVDCSILAVKPDDFISPVKPL
ncbi:MAG: universal stress protein E [Planctomycetota bacterium]|jgi:universal stress protein E